MSGRSRRVPFLWGLLRLGWARGGRAFGVLDVWIAWERLLARGQHIQPLREGGALRYSLRRHGGPAVMLVDGSVVRAGDPLVELHLDNRRFAELTASGRSPLTIVRMLRQDLRRLAALVEQGDLGAVRALHGITFVAAASPILGFEQRTLPHSVYRRLERFFLAGLVLLYHPHGWDAVRHHRARWPGEVWMSTAALTWRYGSGRLAGPLRPSPASLARGARSRSRPAPPDPPSASRSAPRSARSGSSGS